jgi:hypothetical protein
MQSEYFVARYFKLLNNNYSMYYKKIKVYNNRDQLDSIITQFYIDFTRSKKYLFKLIKRSNEYDYNILVQI